MHIVIVGGGKVGKELATNLSTKKQSVVVVEKDPERVKELKKTLGDILVLNEDGANMATLTKAKIRQANIFIAVTQIDELNLMTCMMAKKVKVPVTIARVRNPEGMNNIADTGFTQEEVGVDYIINPEKALALEISKMLHYPEAAEIEYFGRGKVVMIAVTVNQDTGITDCSLTDLPLPPGCIIVGIKREDGSIVVPSGKNKIRPGDKVYLTGNIKVMREASWLLHCQETMIKKVAILGGGTIGYNLAAALEANSEKRFFTKIIEKDEQRCEELNRSLNKTVVIQGDGTEQTYFNEEELAEAEAIVAVTGDDRANIIAALMGQKYGAKKTICEVTEIGYGSVYKAIGIEDYVNPHLITASRILRFTRRGNVQAFSLLREEDVEAMELILPEACNVSNKKIENAGFPKGMLIGAIIRGDDIIIPHGETVLKPDDHLIIFTLTKLTNKLDRFFCKNGR